MLGRSAGYGHGAWFYTVAGRERAGPFHLLPRARPLARSRMPYAQWCVRVCVCGAVVFIFELYAGFFSVVDGCASVERWFGVCVCVCRVPRKCLLYRVFRL